MLTATVERGQALGQNPLSGSSSSEGANWPAITRFDPPFPALPLTGLWTLFRMQGTLNDGIPLSL